MKVLFVHLDLGIGGAEMLVVNAAVAARRAGHDVVVYTSHHDVSRCFKETKAEGVLGGRIRVRGDWLPRHLAFGRFTALCAVARMMWLAACVLTSELPRLFRAAPPTEEPAGSREGVSGGGGGGGTVSEGRNRGGKEENHGENKDGGAATVIFCDGVSAPVPFLRLAGPVLFYCHFPDKLLCVRRGSILKRAYRWPLDRLEEFTTGCASSVAVNSNFTAGIFREAFPRLGRAFLPGPVVSLNRFERKKNLALAVEALGRALGEMGAEEAARRGLRLVVAGGYDKRVAENVEHLSELKAAAERLGLEGMVEFRTNIADDARGDLLRSASCVLYTPSLEHFGIVPVEAMCCGAPVVAVNSGGPLETVVDGGTGFLCPPTPEAFGSAIVRLARDPGLGRSMGERGRQHVKEGFSMESFAGAFEDSLQELAVTSSSCRTASSRRLLGAAVLLMAALAGCTAAAVGAISPS